MRPLAIATLILVVGASFMVLAGDRARGDQLLINPGFEDGVDGWAAIDATVELGDQPRSGVYSGQVTSETNGVTDLFQWIDVQSGQPYSFSGFVLADDPDIERVYLRISWFKEGFEAIPSPEDSTWLTGPLNEYRFVSTGTRIAPSSAVRARLSVQFSASGPFTANVDDMSFEGPPPATASPIPSPTLAIDETPTSSAETPTPRSSGALSQTPAPSDTPTETFTPTPTSPATRTATPTPTRIIPSPTADEPIVFPTLTNGDFERPGVNGAYGWRKIGGTVTTLRHPARGTSALAISSDGTSSTKWAYQTVRVAEGAFYQATAFAVKNDPGVDAAFLRVSWYESDDGSGEAIDSADSAVLTTNDSSFRRVTTGPIPAPTGARTAKVRLMLRPAGEGAAAVYFDDVTFEPTSAPTPTPIPNPTRTPQPTEAPTESPTPVSTDPTASSSPTPTSMPTPTPAPTVDRTPTPTATAAPPPVEPAYFPALTNGGFETARDDGSPYAWRKVGGQMAVTGEGPAGGALALEMLSTTASTKWVYQAVNVEPGKHYEATGWSRSPDAGTDTFLRLSWYSSEDGEGQALSSVDSEDTISGGEDGFSYLTTGPVRAPEDARSVRVRLMLRPPSDARTSALFDDITLSEVTAPSVLETTATPRAVVISSAAQSRTPTVTRAPAVAGAVEEAPPGEARAVVMPTNVRPALAADEAPRPSGDGDGTSLRDVLLAIAVIVPLAGIGGLFALGKKEG